MSAAGATEDCNGQKETFHLFMPFSVEVLGMKCVLRHYSIALVHLLAIFLFS
jgi:hypothetical protein